LSPCPKYPLSTITSFRGGLTTSVERFQSQLQQAKQTRQANLQQNLELIRENGRLRKEIAYHEDRIKPLLTFYYRYLEMHERAQGLAMEASQQMKECDNELLAKLGIHVGTGNLEDVEKF
jgi:hypothetical protein